ncbi:MAG: DUF481 domain-containing protein [Proteobacteria bacterium]|nr:DUF481 domain-containing protein [Pseudomonadota bacterium]
MRVIFAAALLLTASTTMAHAGLAYLQSNMTVYGPVNLKDKAKKKREIYGEFFAGGNKTSGNTDTSKVYINGKIIKEFENSLWESSGNLLHSSADGIMNGQRWLAHSGYLLNFGKKDKWFNNYQITVDHDRFANIDYRALPSTGIGYWFSKEKDYILRTDAGVGYVVTKFRDPDPQDKEESAALIFNGYFKKKVFDTSTISQEVNFIPSLKFEAGFRAKSISTFSNTINGKFDIELKYIVDYNSEPSAQATTTDKIFAFGIKYKFGQ